MAIYRDQETARSLSSAKKSSSAPSWQRKPSETVPQVNVEQGRHTLQRMCDSIERARECPKAWNPPDDQGSVNHHKDGMFQRKPIKSSQVPVQMFRSKEHKAFVLRKFNSFPNFLYKATWLRLYDGVTYEDRLEVLEGSGFNETQMTLAQDWCLKDHLLRQLSQVYLFAKAYNDAGRPPIRLSASTSTHWNGSEIIVRKEKIETMMESLAFETLNAVRNDELKAIHQGWERYGSGEEFAQAIEHIEYENWQKLPQIMHSLGLSVDRYSSFEEYLKAQSSHVDIYVREYNQNKNVTAFLNEMKRRLSGHSISDEEYLAEKPGDRYISFMVDESLTVTIKTAGNFMTGVRKVFTLTQPGQPESSQKEMSTLETAVAAALAPAESEDAD